MTVLLHLLMFAGCFSIQVEGNFYVNDALEKLMFEELRNACRGGAARHLSHGPRWSQVGSRWGPGAEGCLLSVAGVGGFLPAMKQIGNVAALPGIVHVSGLCPRLKVAHTFHTPVLMFLCDAAEIHRPPRRALRLRLRHRQHGGVRHERPGGGGVSR